METEIKYKAVTKLDHLQEIVGLQKLVWDSEIVTSLPQMVAAIYNGGVVIAAFSEDKIIGFCYGFPGFNDSKVYLCSHMMAVHPKYRDLGIGKNLKIEQREWALKYGYDKIVWTYDPLETRNGYLNLCKLGAYVTKYINSYYGEMNDPLNRGLPSDRFLVEWDLNSLRVQKAVAGIPIEKESWKSYSKLLDWEQAGPYPRPRAVSEKKGGKGYLVSVPRNIQEIKEKDMSLAKEWRFNIRRQISIALLNGYAVVGLLRSKLPVHYYVLEKGIDEIDDK